ncbi:OmpA family protein [Pseudozobellia thermophila]|uniref:OmpA family protein n=1 Tax=Pseudozobellia thermophila TaxID=192903 RepID=A0A1M6N6Z5_9FLAO|nr:OmpA family protein [Pseudozobellia thermophila]SHJ91488.1 OmpA family protein [Pseudozobellia thermophila]
MKDKLLALCLLVFTVLTVQAQRKSDLIAEIDDLKAQLDSVSSELFEAKKSERIAVAKAESFETQVTELQDANNTLMKNLNSFAEVSNKNSSIVNSAMASLEAKEKQLKAIKDAIATNDSTTIVVLTNAKQTMGENAKIGVSEGTVVISSDLSSLFGSDTGDKLTPTAEAWVEKVANILKANPKTSVTVEGLSMTGDLNIPAQQALAVANKLKEFGIEAERIVSLGRDGNLKEGVQIGIHPSFSDFYLMVREEMKK